MVSYSSPLPTLIINMRLPTRCREISPQCLPRPRPLELVTLPQSHHLMDTDTAWNMLLLDLGISTVSTGLVDLHIDDYPNYSIWYSADGSCSILSPGPCVCSLQPPTISVYIYKINPGCAGEGEEERGDYPQSHSPPPSPSTQHS